MNYTIIKKLPPFKNIAQEIPLSRANVEKVTRDKHEIKQILSGDDSRLLMIVGPCSAWPESAVIEYAKKLQVLNSKLSDVLKIVMRVYIHKPRTVKGWAGPVNQPNPLSNPDIEAGIRYARQMMIDVIDIGLPLADEALVPHHAQGFIELLSWVAIGARSTENHEHRIFASSIDCAVGLKNPTHGSLDIAVNSIVAAQHPHVAVLDGHEVKTHGNPYAHLVLRGSNLAPNYSRLHLETCNQHMIKHGIKNPAIIVDASHDNCSYRGKKDYLRQTDVIFETMQTLKNVPALRSLVKGFMLESFMKDGNQKVDPFHPEDIDLGGLSITDPCLSFERTEQCLHDLATHLRGL